MRRLRHFVRGPGSDQRGVTLVEFGIIAPVLLLMIMGIFDMGFQIYIRSVMLGEMEKAGRDSSLETGSPNANTIDQKVRDQVRRVLPSLKNNDFTFSRRSYANFSAASAAQPEDWTDTNGNGKCDAGEPYIDANGNNSWDSDGGRTTQGGAKDAVLYRGSVSFPRLFPMAGLLGWSPIVTVSGATVLTNQPYTSQATYTKTPRNCT